MYIKRHRSLCTLCDTIGILVCTNTQDIFNICCTSEDSKDKPLSSDYEEGYEIYEIKSWTDQVKKLRFSKYIPFLPNYDSSSINIVMHCKRGLFSTI
jgi:hypothetical protein